MINENKAKSRKFCCEDLSLIENYDLAVNSDEQYCLHHRLETHDENGNLRSQFLSRDFLKEQGLYYNRPANELIFMPYSEHSRLHLKGNSKSEETRRKLSDARRGRKFGSRSEETKQKISNALKGRKCSAEHRKHNSEAHKGHIISEEQRRKHSERMKGHVGFNKGMHWKLVDGKRVYY